jgi:hypothetical protein
VIEFEELEQPEEAINEITVDPKTVVNAEIVNCTDQILGKHKACLNKSSF